MDTFFLPMIIDAAGLTQCNLSDMRDYFITFLNLCVFLVLCSKGHADQSDQDQNDIFHLLSSHIDQVSLAEFLAQSFLLGPDELRHLGVGHGPGLRPGEVADGLDRFDLHIEMVRRSEESGTYLSSFRSSMLIGKLPVSRRMIVISNFWSRLTISALNSR